MTQSSTDTDPAESDDTPPEALFVIDGTLSRLTAKRGTCNLLREKTGWASLTTVLIPPD